MIRSLMAALLTNPLTVFRIPRQLASMGEIAWNGSLRVHPH